jgi:hypothetical protein
MLMPPIGPGKRGTLGSWGGMLIPPIGPGKRGTLGSWGGMLIPLIGPGQFGFRGWLGGIRPAVRSIHGGLSPAPGQRMREDRPPKKLTCEKLRFRPDAWTPAVGVPEPVWKPRARITSK